jgi:hypothetical protein
MGNKMSMESAEERERSKYKSFPGSTILEKAFCGSIDTTDPSEYENTSTLSRLMKRAEILCVSSPVSVEDKQFHDSDEEDDDEEDENSIQVPTPSKSNGNNRAAGKLLARALVSDLNDPNNMRSSDLKEREKQLLKAQIKAGDASSNAASGKPVGAPSQPHVLRSMAMACTGDDTALTCGGDHNGPDDDGFNDMDRAGSPYSITIGVALSQRNESHGHPDTVTRQTVYDFNALQDRDYKYVSGTSSGWRGGGGDKDPANHNVVVDTTHIPIIRLDCDSEAAVDTVIAALAAGEIFIPHMSILPEALAADNSVRGGPPDVVVKFGCERNTCDDDDMHPDEWPNWCLEFMHNQLYEYFCNTSANARWTRRPFAVTLAKTVRWKTVKHMNKYFAGAEQTIAAWRERRPQCLRSDASPEESARPHGIYMYRNNGQGPTNYFAPNFAPPYNTKMTRSLLLTVLNKSWDKKRREWTSKPVPRLVAPAQLICGFGADSKGFLATEVTRNPQSHHYQQQQSLPPQSQSPEPPDEIEEEDVLSAIDFSPLHSQENRASQEDEKKADDDQEHRPDVSRYSDVPAFDKSKRTVLSDDMENTKSVAHSGYHSVAESGTTVMHGNLTKKSSPKLYSDEDFLDEIDNQDVAQEGQIFDPPGGRVKAPQWRKGGKNSVASPQDAKATAAGGQKEGTYATSSQQTQVKLDRKRATTTSYSMQPSVTSPRNSVGQSASLEFEYSTDGSSVFFTQDASLLGQNYAPSLDEQSRLQKKSQMRMTEVIDEDESMLSLQASSSSAQSVVPTDEELFFVGWAKALDPNSGNYYYFTLDRTKTVWENPLSSSVLGGELPPPVGKQQVDP